jgi:uncharacterized protein (TIGR02284 family)
MESAPIDTSNEVRLLNELIVSTLDNIDEYRRAVFMAEQQLATLQRRVFVQTHAVERMQRHVRALGAQPESHRSPLASAFASLLSRHFLSRDQDQEQLLLDAKRGELLLKRQFEMSSKAAAVSDATRTVLDDVYQSILSERVADQDASWSANLQSSVASTSLHAIPLSN